jgi:histidinol-phosphate phosphatase family protein
MIRAAFLDRDGVINRKAPDGRYVTRWEEMELLPGVAVAIASLNRANFHVIVVSNQRCIAKGLVSSHEVEQLHRRMCGELAAADAVIDAVYYCPHDEQPPCTCRKPAPGMLLKAAKDYGIELRRSWMIGDAETDVAAGRNAGCRTARIAGAGVVGRGTADVIAESLIDATRQILNSDEWRLPCWR